MTLPRSARGPKRSAGVHSVHDPAAADHRTTATTTRSIRSRTRPAEYDRSDELVTPDSRRALGRATSLQRKLSTSLLLLIAVWTSVVWPSVAWSTGDAPTLEELRLAAGQPSIAETLLTDWLEAYPASAHGWAADDLSFVVANLIGHGLAHHPVSPRLAVDQARRHADQRPFRLAPSAKAFSLAGRLLLGAGHNELAADLIEEGLGDCTRQIETQGAFAAEVEATPCAFLVRDHVILKMRRGEHQELQDDLTEAMSWIDPYPRSDAWIPILNTAADLACWHGEVANCFDGYRRATDFARDLLGENHVTTAYGYLGQGWSAALANEWGIARAAFDKAERIWTTHLGPEHPRLADVLVEYGQLLRKSGDASAAVAVLLRAIDLRESRLGPEAFDLPRALDALGLSLVEIGEHSKAEQVLNRSARLRRLHLDGTSIKHVESWTALASLAESLGETEKAEGLLARSLSRLRDQLGADHSATAETSLRLAALIVDRQPERAQELAERARTTLTHAFGADHPSTARAWWLEARAKVALGQDPVPSALQAESIGRQHLRRISVGLSERDLIKYLAVRPQGASLALEAVLAESSRPPSESRSRQIWQEVARSRALIYDTSSARRSVSSAAEPSALAAARQALAHLLVAQQDHRHGEYAARLRSARQRVDREERALSLRLGEPIHHPLDLDHLLSRLASNETLVAFRIFDAASGPRLAAFLAGASPAPKILDLGPWHPIANDLRSWHQAFTGSSELEYRRLAVALREKIWDPLAHWVTTDQCLIVPDGPLFLLSFAALPMGDGYLAETGPTFHYLSAERDLLDAGSRPLPTGRVLIVGGPDFGRPRDPADPDSSLSLRRFEPLPGAIEEVRSVADSWKRWVPESLVELFEGPNASEEEWRRRASGAVAIHLATHGFLLRKGVDRPSSNRSMTGQRGVGGLADRSSSSQLESALAGFALARANQGRSIADATDGSADGIVTPQEIRQMDLRAARLVVLSFCDSGSGETLNGEGIFGLSRAFRSAGASSLVLALAPVSDRDSKRLMEHFYTGLLSDRLTVDTALRRASLRLLNELRRAGEDTHPRRWGALVSTGTIQTVDDHSNS